MFSTAVQLPSLSPCLAEQYYDASYGVFAVVGNWLGTVP